MQSKFFGRVTVAIFASLSAAGACAQSAPQPDKTEDVKRSSAQAGTNGLAGKDVQLVKKTEEVGPVNRKEGTATVRAQPEKKSRKTEQFKPHPGQEGKDVVWVPTPQPLVDRMLDMAKLAPSDIHFDLGSGDGRMVITAAKRGAKSTGVEFNPNMVALSRRIAKQEGVGDKARFVEGDIFKTDFSNATVVTLFLLKELNLKLRPRILDMKPGTRVVSNTFGMGEWQADQTSRVSEKEGCTDYCTAHLWIVPAKVEGTWRLANGELTLTQTFQRVSGTLAGDQISGGTLRGDEITFNAGNALYTGRVNGNTVTGTVETGSNSRVFTATRVSS